MAATMSARRRAWTQFVGTVGAIANWTIPISAMANIYNQQDPKKIDPRMTSLLCAYSLIFMRWSLAITPPNYPLLLCHVCNEAVQLVQLGRWATAKSEPEKIEASH